jgi:site-specific recombinase XerD
MLKHSIAVHLLEIWLSIFEVKHYLWHKSINSTMIYSSFSSLMNKEMYNKINKWGLVV